MNPSIFEYIKQEENSFKTDEIQIADNWNWNFRNHIQMSMQLKNGIFTTGQNNWIRPFKKVIEPILNLRYRAEDIELKDVILYIENDDERILSFLIKKYHDEVYVKENNLDMFFDEAIEEQIDYGGVLVQQGKNRPEVLPLQFVAFCDQTDIQGGPIAFKYYFSPDKLRTMSTIGWGDKSNGATISLDELIVLANSEKDTGNKKNKTTGKNVEIYIIHGSFPEHYLLDNDNMDKYYNQLHIVAFYPNNKEKRGSILYRKKEVSNSIKFFTAKQIRGRALGVGGVEMLFNEQIWTNFLEIHKMKLLESAAKVPLYTDDTNYANRNKIQDMENLEIMTISGDSKYGIRQVPTAAPVNIQLFERSINEWWQNAQLVGSAQDPLLGRQSYAGQTFRGQERLLQEGRSIHEYRRGKFAKFIEEIYRDWIIPKIVKEIIKGKKFLTILSSDELKWITERLAENEANRTQMEAIINGNPPEDKEILIQKFKTEFSKKGNKHIIEILKDEFKDVEIRLDINVAGKQKNLGELTDKIVAIFRFIFANPQGFQQVMQIPGMQASFNDILELSGLSPVHSFEMPSTSQSISSAQSTQIPELLNSNA